MDPRVMEDMLEECIIINVDPGWAFSLAMEHLAFKIDGERVVRHQLVKSSALQSIIDRAERRMKKAGANIAKIQAELDRALYSARDRIIHELCETAGITAFVLKTTTDRGVRTQVRPEDATWKHLSDTTRRHVIINVGADSSHPGKKRGVNSANFGPALVRRLIDHLTNIGVSFWANKIDEFRTSKNCPDPYCKDEDGLRPT
jgi:hypothetical protein